MAATHRSSIATLGRAFHDSSKPVEPSLESLETGPRRVFSHVCLFVVSLDVVFRAQDMGQHWVEMGITRNFDLEVTGSGTCGFDINRQEDHRRVRWGPRVDFPMSPAL